MLKNKYVFILIYCIILGIAIFLRLYRLSDVPPGVNRDEADIGFTASSLLHTGKDEYGRILPLSIQSFGDWKLPLYIHETVVSVGIFGLNTFAVRIPSAIAGITTVCVSFFLFEELFHKPKFSLLAMLLFAIAPWSLHLSRVESESNTAIFFINVKSFGKYEFRPIDWPNDLNTPNEVLIDISKNVDQSIHNNYKTTDVLLPSHKPMFTVVETK